MNLTVKNRKRSASLIPYLTPGGNGFSIKLAAGQNHIATDQPFHSIFHIISESNPFSKIVQAELHAGKGVAAEPLFLMTQKDRYILTDEMEPATNIEIDRYWQEAYSYYSGNRLNQPPLLIKDQIDREGKLVQFQPLWYCRFKQSYFPPVCPVCGDPLEQCCDDDLLVENGLQSFSDSIQRYLYCPGCGDSKGDAVCFYVPDLYKDAPANLKSCEDLIKDIGRLKRSENIKNGLPCVGCDQHLDCFGEENKVFSRIAVFSFFPFYMIGFVASCAHSIDLISRIPEIRTPETQVSETKVSETPISETSQSGIVQLQNNAPDPAAELEQKPSVDIDQGKKEIQRILKNILKTWQKGSEVSPIRDQDKGAALSETGNRDLRPTKTKGTAGESDLEKTVIISPGNVIAEKISTMVKKQGPADKTKLVSDKAHISAGKQNVSSMANTGMEKTLIITADTIQKPPSASGRKADKTVILKPKANPVSDKTAIAPNNGDLDKTLIISPDSDAAGKGRNASTRTIIFGDDMEVSENAQPDTSLEKTVIIAPQKKNAADGKDDIQS